MMYGIGTSALAEAFNKYRQAFVLKHLNHNLVRIHRAGHLLDWIECRTCMVVSNKSELEYEKTATGIRFNFKEIPITYLASKKQEEA